MKRKSCQKSFPIRGYDDGGSRAGSEAMVAVVTWPGRGNKSRQELKVRIRWKNGEQALKEANDGFFLHYERIS